MSRSMGAGGPGPWSPRPAPRPPERIDRGEPVLVRELDLREPPAPIDGGATTTRVWLLLRFGDVAVGDLAVAVPAKGLTGAEVGAAVARRVGTRWRRTAGGDVPAPAVRDGQPRSRNRGRTSSE
jgi:hypothetical protein